MAQKNFKKEDFVNTDDQYQIEYKKEEIGQGSDLTVERIDETGSYEVIQAEIKRFNDRIFICWSEPFDGRIIFNQ
jgi:hypothetical protein